MIQIHKTTYELERAEAQVSKEKKPVLTADTTCPSKLLADKL